MKVNALNVSREDFPKSTATVEGMQVIDPPCDNYEIAYHYDIKYHERDDRAMYLQILQPLDAKEKTPLIIYIPGSAFHRQNVRERVPQLALLAARGFCVALLEYSFLIPANRIGSDINGGPFSLVQLKVIQEVISCVVFGVIVSVLFKGETLQWNHFVAVIFLVLAVYFVFLK